MSFKNASPGSKKMEAQRKAKVWWIFETNIKSPHSRANAFVCLIASFDCLLNFLRRQLTVVSLTLVHWFSRAMKRKRERETGKQKQKYKMKNNYTTPKREESQLYSTKARDSLARLNVFSARCQWNVTSPFTLVSVKPEWPVKKGNETGT